MTLLPTALLPTLFLKSLLVFAAAGTLLFVLRRSSAAARHLACLLTLSAALALPLFSLALPGWHLPVLTVSPLAPNPGGTGLSPSASPAPGSPSFFAAALHAAPKETIQDAKAARAASAGAARLGGTPSRTPTPAPPELGAGGLFALYLLGLLLASVRPLLGLWGIHRLSRHCTQVDEAALTTAAACASLLGLRTPRLCWAADVPVPMTWGWRRPVIVLPPASADWPEDRLRSVLLHEMAHIKRRDWPGHRLADLTCAVYWFHPLVWLTARRLRAESEAACDDLVLASGIPAPDYARHLLEIASALPRVPDRSHAAIAMAQTSHIESRLTMILDKTRSRRTVARRVLVVGITLGAAALVLLSILRPAVQAAPPQPRAAAVFAESEAMQRERQYALENSRLLRGEKLTPQAARGQEQRLAVQPDDYAAHLCLLGYYLSNMIFGKPLTASAAQPAYRQQVFWLIQNHPESQLFSRANLGVPRIRAKALFAGDKTLWEAQLAKYPNNAVVLDNAAAYYLLSDEAAAEKYLLQAQSVQPKSPVWPDKLGEFYRLQGEGPSPSPAVVRQSAIKALAEYEIAARLAEQMFHSATPAEPNTSADLAKTAFDAGEYDKARRYAEALLHRGQEIAAEGKADPRQPAFIFNEDSNAIHEANLVLGRLALHDGNIAEAEAHLLAMGRVSGSSQLDSFGPNMRLAADLLKIGKRDTVLAYFDECAKFWKDKQLGVWRSEVEVGKIPNFQGNLDY